MKFSKKDLTKQANWWSAGSGRIELEMTPDQAASVSGQGQHDEDARWLVKELRPQLDKIDPKVLASELKEYGAWDDKELSDHEENLQRLVWIAGNDIIEKEYEPEETTEIDVENFPTMDVEKAKDDLLTQLSIETDPEKKKSLERRYKHLTMASLKKQAGLKEFSNQETKDANNYIASHGDILHVVVGLAQKAMSEQDLESSFRNSLSNVFNEFGIDPSAIRWNELAYAYYTSIQMGEDTKRRFNKQEPLTNFDINKLPTLDKPKKIDELLEQLSIEQDPTKKEKIKQHIERIKRAKLLKADVQNIPSVLYHATYKPLLNKIKKQGLNPPVYLAVDKDEAASYAEVAMNSEGLERDIPEEWLDQIVIIEIPSSILDQKFLTTDPNVLVTEEDKKKGIYGTLVYSQAIPISNLAVTKYSNLQKKADNVLGDPMHPIQPAIDRGQQEVSRFDPEYEFLVKLVKLISKTSPEAIPEIKALSQSQPFHTIDDIGDLTAKIWTLATTKYNIPREWLISKLPEKKGSLSKKAKILKMQPYGGGVEFPILVNPTLQEALGLMRRNQSDCVRIIVGLGSGTIYIWDSYNATHDYVLCSLVELGYEEYSNVETGQFDDETDLIKYFKQNKTADLWPAQEEASEGTITQGPGQIAYNPDQEKDTSVSGPNPQDIANEDAIWDIVVNEFLTAHKRWSEVVKAIRLAHPEVTDEVILSLKDRVKKSLDNQMGMVGSKKVAGNVISIDGTRVYKNPTSEQIKNLLQKAEGLELRALVDPINYDLYVWDAFKMSHYDGINNLGLDIDWANEDEANKYTWILSNDDSIKYLFEEIQKAKSHRKTAKRHLNMDQVIKALKQADPNVTDSVILSLKDRVRKSLDNQMGMIGSKKVAGLEERGYWISPDGIETEVLYGSTHEYSLPSDVVSIEDALEKGWTRIRESNYEVNVEVSNIHSVPVYVDKFLDRYLPNNMITMSDLQHNVISIDGDDITHGIQKAINKELSYKRLQPVTAKHHLNMDQVIKILDSKEPKVDHINFIDNTIELIDHTVLTFDEATQKAVELDKTAEGEFTGAEFSTDAVGVNPSMDSGPFSSPADSGATPQKKPFPNTMWDVATDDEDESQPYSNVASSKKAFCKKEANPSTRYWIAPDGKEFPVSGIHPVWLQQNPKILKQYGINPKQATYEIHDQMMQNGWSRVSTEYSGFQIEVADLSKLPTYLDNFIAKNFSPGDEIVIGNRKQPGVHVFDPFPSIQRAVNKALRNPRNGSLNKKASSIEQVGDTKVYINPSFEQAVSLLGRAKYVELRGIVEPSTGMLFIWDSNKLTHNDVIRALGIDIDPYDNETDSDYLSVMSETGGLDYMFSMQQEAREKLSKRPKKTAAISGNIINDILKSIESTGGVTYNLSKGNLAGTDNYSVSIYPEKEKIVSLVDFEEIENYIDSNEDLLSQPNNSFGAWTNGNQVYLDIVVTIPDKEQALKLARENNQLAIWDLKNSQEIPTGVVRAFSKKTIVKIAEESPLTEQDQNEIAAASCPAYVMAVNNFYSANSRGHDKDRSLAYAIDSVKNLEQIDEKKLVEFINTYLSPVK